MDLEIIIIYKASLCVLHDDDLHINCLHKCMDFTHALALS